MKRRDFTGLSSLSGFAGLDLQEIGVVKPSQVPWLMLYHWILDLISTDLEILLFENSQ